ncbi:uncharacterized protein LOC123527544 [Mercenaria mercenaria]|uniref:uncharacterized protein LOC123527544 n=1 Tax=Mercenaria mercenaria TaxID=6596 RepID=UPI00234E61EA|nr:uncharacterized protein LOC123527544 [Mercenaria mercenaria]
MTEGTETASKTDTKVYELDEEMEMFCEFCYKDGKQNQPADGFCVECVTYFCATCLNYHEKFHPNHTQQDKDKMPQDFYIQTCSQHSDALIKFYCLTCETTACSTSRVNDHEHCEEIHHLPQLVKDFDKIKELVDIKNAIEEAEKEVDAIELIVDGGMEKIKQYNNEAKCALKKDRKEINELFDELENEVNDVETLDSENLEMVEGNIILTKAKIKTLKSQIENKIVDITRSEVFVAAKEAKMKSQSILNNLKDTRTHLEETEISKYVYVPTKKTPQDSRHGKLTAHKEKVKNDKLLVWLLVVLLSALTIDIFLIHFETSPESHEIKLSFDPQQLCYISKENLLAIAFSQNTLHTINITDGRHNEILNGRRAYTSTSITTMKDNMVAILSSDGYILMHDVTYTNVKKYRQSIYVPKHGQHIAYSNNIFYILYGGEERHIESYNMNGQLLTNIPIWNKFQIISPWNIAVSPNNNIIYLTDSDLVIMLTMDGTVQGYFRHIDLIRPIGMAIDTAGNLYVCGYVSNNVFKISPDFSHGYEILGKRHGLNRPFSITQNEKENELPVGSFGRKSIQVFKLSQTWFQYIRSFF